MRRAGERTTWGIHLGYCKMANFKGFQAAIEAVAGREVKIHLHHEGDHHIDYYGVVASWVSDIPDFDEFKAGVLLLLPEWQDWQDEAMNVTTAP